MIQTARLPLAAAFFCIISTTCLAQKTYEQAWAALNRNDRKLAQNVLDKAGTEGENSADRYITDIYLKSYDGKDTEITDFDKAFYDRVENPYPYIYALWFNNAVFGDYGKKKYAHQLKLMDKLLADPNAHGTLVAAAYYQKGIHLQYSNSFDQAQNEFRNVGNLKNWQYVGPFENLSHSGFYKDYGPLEHPDNKTEFTSSSSAKVKWFAPTEEIQDGWNPVVFQFNKRTGVVYAQTFVTSSKDQEVLCNVGVGGAIKVWINDAIVISEYTERVTEMDTYTAKCKLQKGVNRFLVQLAFTDMKYGNYSVRLTDENFRPIPGLTGSNVYKPYKKAMTSTAKPLKHFAEAFFQDKIAKEPGNMVNYLLLADVYLRNKKTNEARSLMESALRQEPENNILRMKLISVLLKQDNRSVMLEEVGRLRKSDPESLVTMELDIQNAINNERLDEAMQKVKERESLYGEDITTIGYRLNFLFKEKKFDDFISLAEGTYKKYPDEPLVVRVMYSIRKEVYRDPKGALKTYEDFLATNYNHTINDEYIKLLQEDGQVEQSLQRRKLISKAFSYDPDVYSEMANYHFTAKEYTLAEENVSKALQRSPYNEQFLELMGDIKSNQNKPVEAIDAYNKSLLFDPNQYDVINKLRKLRGKSESYQLVPSVNIDDVIGKDNPAEAPQVDVGYYIISEDKCSIIHPGGAVEEYTTYIVRITNENGINEFKESRIDYNNSQTLLIEQSEVIKKSGAKIKGERNDNVIVFPNLEAGDVIAFSYRLQNYKYGRFGRDFWQKHFFATDAYIAHSRYTLLAPPSQKVNYMFSNSSLQPVVSTREDFKQYTWEVSKQRPLKEESLMPSWVDIAPVLHVSTVSKWNDIAVWYADMINNSGEETYELKTVFDNLFPNTETQNVNQFEKARRIYNYIETNIRYSSVPFRQSAYLPQSASKTLSTRLGDCKDLSNLFVTLCRMANIDVRMVLVDTRDNGTKDMILPSLEFNHCIAKASLDGKEYYIELTDNYLPFASLPNNLVGALILEIPRKSETMVAELKSLLPQSKWKDITSTHITVRPSGSDLVVQVSSGKHGHLSSQLRHDYLNLTYDKQLSQLEKSTAASYRNVNMESASLQHLDDLADSVTLKYQFRIKDEIAEIGSLHTFKLPFVDVVASLSKLPAGTREYPLNYNKFEDTDVYETTILVELPPGKKLVELPAGEELTFGGLRYSLVYSSPAPDKLQVKRKFTSDRNEIPANKYVDFRTFMEKIVKAEQKMIAYQ